MLYDPRWEKQPFEPPASKRSNVFALLLAAFIPVFIGAYTIAVSLDEILILVIPVLLNAAGLLLTRRRAHGAANGRDHPFAG